MNEGNSGDNKNSNKNNEDERERPQVKSGPIVSKINGFDPALLKQCDCSGARHYRKAAANDRRRAVEAKSRL